jgi:biopolymer transport protein ExbB/TolQ
MITMLIIITVAFLVMIAYLIYSMVDGVRRDEEFLNMGFWTEEKRRKAKMLRDAFDEAVERVRAGSEGERMERETMEKIAEMDRETLDRKIAGIVQTLETTVRMMEERGLDSAKVIQVIETVRVIGKGTKDDPCRYMYEYWDFEGKKLAGSDGTEV